MKHCYNCVHLRRETELVGKEGVFDLCRVLAVSIPQKNINKNLDCSYYIRKWYKFWIKDNLNTPKKEKK